MKDQKFYHWLLFSITFFIFIFWSILTSLKYLTFRPVADNVTYSMEAESIFYDRDLKLEVKDFKRYALLHPEIDMIHTPVISKKDNKGTIFFGKPIVYASYISLFSPIKNGLYRGIISNLILVFVIMALAYKILRDKFGKNDLLFILVWLFFCSLLYFSQLNFYMIQINPEVFINFLVIISILPFFFNTKNNLLLLFSGTFGGMLMFEKQLAMFFPLLVIIYLFFEQKNKSKFYTYLFSFTVSSILLAFLSSVLQGDKIAYEGLRGLTWFNGVSLTLNAGKPVIFTFPLAYYQRFLEYFLGRNIGIFLYNPAFLVFIYIFITKIFNNKNRNTLLLFLPTFLYLLVYFIAIDPSFAYGGSTSIGNRYFFQIFISTLLIAFYFLSDLDDLTKKLILFLCLGIISFSAIVYLPFYVNSGRAIIDHLNIVSHGGRITKYFPMELAYADIIYGDLTLENRGLVT